MRMKTFLRLGGSVLLTTALAACGSSGSMTPTPTPTPTPAPTPTPTAGPASFQSMFGPAFAAIFDAAMNSEPVEPTDASVPALAPASEPLDN